MIMRLFSRKIQVAFVDDATGETFAKTEMPPANLPESFEIATTLHLGDADWSVVHAQPKTRADYTKSKSLILRLRKIEKIPADAISYSQLDITERLYDDQNLGKDEWISTTPINSRIKKPGDSGLPSLDADSEEVYQAASKLSDLRESISIPGDGVYCPICHIANIDLKKLRTPCPKCGRKLLRFGWT
jgi:hypothetical protein